MRYYQSLAFALIPILIASCGLPRDEKGTLDKVRGGEMRVGVSDNPPWIYRDGEEARGAEAAIIQQFADSLGARVTWFWGTPEEHLEALERYELDLVAAGLTMSTPWKTRVGMTKPFFVDTVAVGAPSGVIVPDDLEGVRVAARHGSVEAALVREQGATVTPLDSMTVPNGLAAAPLWKLRDLGLRSTDRVLRSNKHIMAVPSGENGWLMALEHALTGWNQDEIDRLLREKQQ